MADYLINFISGEDIKASETNSNNQFLLDKISDNAENIQKYIGEQLGTIQSNISSIQKTLQQNIDKLGEQIEDLKNAKFTSKTTSIGVGTTNLSSYLPDDNKHYLVWVTAWVSQKSGAGASIATDLMPAVTFLQLDGDSGRSSQDAALCVVPVGPGRTLTIAGTISGASLRGYCKV